MTAPLLLDLSHTSHTRARTGIQRVARSLHESLGVRAVPICHDPYLGAWRELEPWEQANLTAEGAASAHRGARWPFGAKFRGRLRRVLGIGAGLPAATRHLPSAEGVLVPEIFSPAVAAALPALLAAAAGPRAALFHDAIALKLPELTPTKTVARFPAYLHELLQFDGIAAVSEDSRDALVDYWRWLGLAHTPPVEVIPLGIDSPPPPSEGKVSPASFQLPVILCVGSLEGRKNHLALLDACERLWSAGTKFELRLIGLAHPQTGRAALERIKELQAAGRLLRYDGAVDDETLETAYAGCSFTVYPSLMEGFGLPVLESVARGKPCVCSARGALGESARGGGCIALPSVDAGSLAGALARLLATPHAWAALAVGARSRSFKTTGEYADELLEWLRTLPRRDSRRTVPART
ncbi:MAG TPA: glycosyltransferase [Opitutaceae bacterium]|nr:glycosyltransferase [Opitutaceae bacterium]